MRAILSVVKNKIPKDRPLVEYRATLAFAVIVAGWPVVRWFVARLGDGSDEPMGLLALAAALIFAPRRGWSEPVGVGRMRALVCVLAGYIAGFSILPPLGHALLWIAALGLVAAPSGFAFAWTTLLVLSLPLVASLQFYLGYPLRCVTTEAAALLLNLVGIHAAGDGTMLRWAGERVLIDAPCSGIQMLWTLLVVGAVLANARQLGGRATFQLFRFAGLVVSRTFSEQRKSFEFWLQVANAWLVRISPSLDSLRQPPHALVAA